MNLEDGWYLLVREGEDPVIVRGYWSFGEFVFGLNIHDGGDLIPLSDLEEDATYTALKFVNKYTGEMVE